MKKERDRAQKQARHVDEGLAALGGIGSNGSPRQHTMPAAGRRRVNLALKARWAKLEASKPKRTMSAAARRKIAAAQRARWARVRRESKAA